MPLVPQNKRTMRRFWMVARIFFFSEMKWKARGLLLLLAGFSLTVSYVNVWISFVGRDFYDALTMKNAPRFYDELVRYILAFAVASIIVAFYRYTEERLALLWRRWLSLRLISMYFSNRSYYRIGSENLVDNPDQRIEADIRSFTSQTLSFMLILLNSVIGLCLFVRVLWSISSSLTLVAVGYAVFGSFMSYLLGRQLVWLNFTQLQREADYRYKLVNVRDNSESIALYHGERKEQTRTRQLLSRGIDNFRRIIAKNRNLNIFTNIYNYLIPIIPPVIVAPLYFSGEISLGAVNQATVAFAQTLGALSIIVTNFGSLSAFGAVVNRLGTFFEALEEIEWRKERAQGVIDYRHENRIAFEGVTINTPRGGAAIVKNVTFSLNAGQRLLICGPSGSGKSTILRAIAGLWNSGGGLIIRPRLRTTLFLPQRPYMILGSFRNQLLYVKRRRGVTDKIVLQAIKDAQLESTITRVGNLDTELDWANVLSMGEQQRIAFARLFIVQPKFAFLDEATTAVEPAGQATLYAKLGDYVESYVSVGHRDALAHFHDCVLTLSGDGTWEFESLV